MKMQNGCGMLVLLALCAGAWAQDFPVKPLRVIQGPKTLITDPSRLATDPANNEIFVPLGNKVLVFPREAKPRRAPRCILRYLTLAGIIAILGSSS